MTTDRFIKILILISGLLLGQPVWATTFTVNTTTIGTPAADNDTSAGNGTCINGAGFCSFRAAIQEANALAGADTIELVNGATYTATCNGCTDGTDVFQALPRITTDITINGNTSTITNTGNNRFVTITAGTVVINNLTFSNGAPGDPGDGGARAGAMNVAGGTLTLNTCTFSNNVGSGVDTGGAINLFGGTLNINNSTFNANGAPAIRHNLGGVLNITGSTFTNGNALWTTNPGLSTNTISNSLFEGSSITPGVNSIFTISNSIFKDCVGPALFAWQTFNISISNTTFKGTAGVALLNSGTASMSVTNSAFLSNTGGGITFNAAGSTMTVSNSTFSGNTATGGKGGAILATDGLMTITNSTLSQNTSSGSGGGVYTEAAATVTVQNSIISGNTATTAGNDCTGATSFTSGGNNIIGDTSGCTGLSSVGSAGLAALVDQTSTSNVSGTAGRAWYPLTDSSAAIDMGNAGACSATDQLGNSRISTCDIGAVELAGPDLSVAAVDSPDPLATNQTLTYTVTITNSGSASAANVTLALDLANSMDLSSATPGQGSCSLATLLCSLGTINSGASATVSLVAVPRASGNNSSSFVVSTTDLDANSANDTATVSTTVTPADGSTLTVTTTANTAGHDATDAALSFNEAYLLIIGTLTCADFEENELASACDNPNTMVFDISGNDSGCTNGICTIDISTIPAGYNFPSSITLDGGQSIILDATESLATTLFTLLGSGSTFLGITILGNGQTGISVQANDFTLTNADFTEFGTAISVTNSSNFTAGNVTTGIGRGGLIAAPGEIGLLLSGVTNAMITGSTFSANQNQGIRILNSSNITISNTNFGTTESGTNHLVGTGWQQNTGLYVDPDSFDIFVGPNDVFRYHSDYNILCEGFCQILAGNLISETFTGETITITNTVFQCKPEIIDLFCKRAERGASSISCEVSGTTCGDRPVFVYVAQFEEQTQTINPLIYIFGSETMSQSNGAFTAIFSIELDDESDSIEVVVYTKEETSQNGNTREGSTPPADPFTINESAVITIINSLSSGGCQLNTHGTYQMTKPLLPLRMTLVVCFILMWMTLQQKKILPQGKQLVSQMVELPPLKWIIFFR